MQIHYTATDEPRARRRTRVPFPTTSLLAYKQAVKADGYVCAAILALLEEHGPMTDDELHRAYLGRYKARTRQRIGTARRGLADVRLVRDTGRTGLSDLGNRAKVWELAPADSVNGGA